MTLARRERVTESRINFQLGTHIRLAYAFDIYRSLSSRESVQSIHPPLKRHSLDRFVRSLHTIRLLRPTANY